MILPDDQDTLKAMMGTGMDPLKPPKEFVDEYLLRLGMMSRAGRSGALGPAMLCQLLRDLKMEPKGQPQMVVVSDWSGVAPNTVISYEGRRGVYLGAASDGYCIIRLDGQRSAQEVDRSRVTLALKPVDGIDESAFKREPEPPAAGLLKSEAEKQAEQSAEQPDFERQAILNQWGTVEAGERVHARINGKTVDAEFVDISEERLTLLVVYKGKRHELQPSEVTRILAPAGT